MKHFPSMNWKTKNKKLNRIPCLFIQKCRNITLDARRCTNCLTNSIIISQTRFVSLANVMVYQFQYIIYLTFDWFMRFWTLFIRRPKVCRWFIFITSSSSNLSYFVGLLSTKLVCTATNKQQTANHTQRQCSMCFFFGLFYFFLLFSVFV